jgi:hypothetical protein
VLTNAYVEFPASQNGCFSFRPRRLFLPAR